jgi:molecular chaperone GrpE
MTKKHHTKEKYDSAEKATPEEMTADMANPVGEMTEPVAEETESPDSASVAGLEAQLREMETAKTDYYNRMLRIQADFDNFRRRSRQEYEQACLYGGEELIKKILPVLDSLERAVAAFSEKSADNCSWQEGVRLTLKQFQNILTAEGLEAVEAVNLVFDPQVHEAVFQEQSDAVSDPTVREELQKGYKYRNKLIRPALVKVAVPS